MTDPELYLPSALGRAAFDELDRVPWAELPHAYGVGTVGPDLSDDVPATLRQLGETDREAFHEGVDALFSNLCHQGTIYEATAFSVPFLAAFAAGTDLGPDQVPYFVAIFASIGIASSFEAPHGSHAGSHGPGVAPLTREALRMSGDVLAMAAQRNPGLEAITAALARMVSSEPPDPAAVERLESISDELDGED
ncbi:MAG TPA: hypothetical protein VJR89_04895 [Polyangiales bacterium]|nr:hypothetical protein [Polyangiales bacterium]